MPACRSNKSQTMLERVYGCFMTCNIFLASNSEVSLELQRFSVELITYIVCEFNAPECNWLLPVTAQTPAQKHICDKMSAKLSKSRFAFIVQLLCNKLYFVY